MGTAHAELMAERGAVIIAQDLDGARAEATAALVRKKGGVADAVACDVADVAALTATLDQVLAIHGRVDILVNND
ncbi:SDR family oxidoreductase, partial [Acinetobacter baumannii]|uniref:SDR family oxidoreductase n=1 Tax=Acinetobacter baumannii TaxID=470 RepID=UPI003327F03A